MRPLPYLIYLTSLSLLMISCSAGPDQPVTATDGLNRDSLALLDSLRSQLDGWEAQLLEGINDLKVTVRLKEDSLAVSESYLPEDSTLIALKHTAKILSDSLRSGLIYGTVKADEAGVETLTLLQALVANSQTQKDLGATLELFCAWAGTTRDTTPILQ